MYSSIPSHCWHLAFSEATEEAKKKQEALPQLRLHHSTKNAQFALLLGSIAERRKTYKTSLRHMRIGRTFSSLSLEKLLAKFPKSHVLFSRTPSIFSKKVVILKIARDYHGKWESSKVFILSGYTKGPLNFRVESRWYTLETWFSVYSGEKCQMGQMGL